MFLIVSSMIMMLLKVEFFGLFLLKKNWYMLLVKTKSRGSKIQSKWSIQAYLDHFDKFITIPTLAATGHLLDLVGIF